MEDWYEVMTKEQEELNESMKESFKQRDERLAKEQGMIRLYTNDEKEIMKKGLSDGETKED